MFYRVLGIASRFNRVVGIRGVLIIVVVFCLTVSNELGHLRASDQPPVPLSLNNLKEAEAFPHSDLQLQGQMLAEPRFQEGEDTYYPLVSENRAILVRFSDDSVGSQRQTPLTGYLVKLPSKFQSFLATRNRNNDLQFETQYAFLAGSSRRLDPQGRKFNRFFLISTFLLLTLMLLSLRRGNVIFKSSSDSFSSTNPGRPAGMNFFGKFHKKYDTAKVWNEPADLGFLKSTGSFAVLPRVHDSEAGTYPIRIATKDQWWTARLTEKSIETLTPGTVYGYGVPQQALKLVTRDPADYVDEPLYLTFPSTQERDRCLYTLRGEVMETDEAEERESEPVVREMPNLEPDISPTPPEPYIDAVSSASAGLIPSLVAVLFASALIGLAVSLVNLYLGSFLGMEVVWGMGLGFLLKPLLFKTRLRNTRVLKCLLLLGAINVFFTHWAIESYQMRPQLVEYLSGQVGAEEAERLLTPLRTFQIVVDYRADYGIHFGGDSREELSVIDGEDGEVLQEPGLIHLRGPWFWVFTGLEILLIYWFSWAVAGVAATHPICRTCHKGMVLRGRFDLHFDSLDEAKRALGSGDFKKLLDLEATNEHAKTMVQGYSCPGCNTKVVSVERYFHPATKMSVKATDTHWSTLFGSDSEDR